LRRSRRLKIKGRGQSKGSWIYSEKKIEQQRRKKRGLK